MMLGEGVMVGVGVSVGVNVLVGVGVSVGVGVDVGVLVGVSVLVHAAAVAVPAVAFMVAICSADGPPPKGTSQAAVKARKRIRKTVRFIRIPREKITASKGTNLFELNEGYQQCYNILSQRLDVVPALHHQQRWEVQTGN